MRGHLRFTSEWLHNASEANFLSGNFGLIQALRPRVCTYPGAFETLEISSVSVIHTVGLDRSVQRPEAGLLTAT